MGESAVRIGVVAPASRIDPAIAERVAGLAATLYPHRPPEIFFHPQCFLSHGHFAGDDEARLQAFLDVANDDSFDALWFARGGYGSCRLTERLLPALTSAARRKAYLGYSDAGTLLGALYRHGYERVAHAPMPADVNREGGHAAVGRALAFLVEGARSSLEPTLPAKRPAAAFNMTILAHLLGTPWQPDLTGHILMLEEVAEHMYRIDRTLCHITGNPGIRRAAGIMLGRCSDIPPNRPDFGQSEEAVTIHWCNASRIPYLGRADIGHDAENKVVPFGWWGAVSA